MSTLAEIEAAADSLSNEEKEQLLCFLSTRLRPTDGTPAVKDSSVSNVGEWLRKAKGSIRLVRGESPDDARMAYYTRKYKLPE